MSLSQINKNSHVCLVDASAYIFRAFHALPALSRKSDCTPIGGVTGFFHLHRHTENTPITLPVNTEGIKNCNIANNACKA